jgi:hypothetical protein
MASSGSAIATIAPAAAARKPILILDMARSLGAARPSPGVSLGWPPRCAENPPSY